MCTICSFYLPYLNISTIFNSNNWVHNCRLVCFYQDKLPAFLFNPTKCRRLSMQLWSLTSYGIVDILFLISMGRRLVVVGLIFLK